MVDELLINWRDGIWVWDIELNEPVLVIPEVLALLGDNPMQRKLFCRACWVKGHDAMDGDDEDEPSEKKPPTPMARGVSQAVMPAVNRGALLVVTTRQPVHRVKPKSVSQQKGSGRQ
ncbi:hypothetical protein B0H14DRAFT_2642406 [Mycena olivaceomarginata]|nr:hypothetical protein B0H14DRAFT_2642406 [Mycena olivaceomarginata]